MRYEGTSRINWKYLKNLSNLTDKFFYFYLQNMKKWSIIGAIILIVAVWIWWLLKIDHIKDNESVSEEITGNMQENIFESGSVETDIFTWEDEIIPEENEAIVEKEEPKNLPVLEEDYPMYWVIENDYWDETLEDENDENLQETEQLLKQALDERDKGMEQEKIIKNISVTIDGKKYVAELENNETAQAFYKNYFMDVPAEFLMEELNWNEKYVYLQVWNLPTNSKVPEKIEAWDIMLYWSDCIVIFYKSFSTSYSYTKIGHIKNLEALWDANVKVVFSK